MAVDYLKTYLGIDPNDYSSMEARIRGEEPQAQVPLMRQPTMMPQTRSLGEMEAMPMAPRSQPTPQVDDRYQSLMDEISSLKAQIDALQTPVVEEAPMMPIEPEVAEAPMMPSVPSVTVEQLQNRMVGEPQKLPQEPVPFQTQAPSQDIQASIDYLAKLPKMNIPQIPDIEQIRQKMEEANMTFPEPVSYQDQLQAIKDLPPVTPMPQAIKQPSRSGIFGNLLDRVQKPNQMPQSRRGGFFGNLLDRVQKQIEVPTPPSMPASPMLQTKPAYMPTRARSMLDIQQKFAPQRFADGGGINKAIYDLKFKLNG